MHQFLLREIKQVYLKNVKSRWCDAQGVKDADDFLSIPDFGGTFISSFTHQVLALLDPAISQDEIKKVILKEA